MPDIPVTLATASSASRNIKLEQLSAEQKDHTGFSHWFRIPHDILNNPAWTTQGDTVTVTVGNTPARWIMNRCSIDISTAFTTTGTLTLSLGTTASPALSIAATTATTAGIINGLGTPAAATVGTSSTGLVVRFSTQASTGAPANITAGVADVFLQLVDVADLT